MYTKLFFILKKPRNVHFGRCQHLIGSPRVKLETHVNQRRNAGSCFHAVKVSNAAVAFAITAFSYCSGNHGDKVSGVPPLPADPAWDIAREPSPGNFAPAFPRRLGDRLLHLAAFIPATCGAGRNIAQWPVRRPRLALVHGQCAMLRRVVVAGCAPRMLLLMPTSPQILARPWGPSNGGWRSTGARTSCPTS